jgi:sulfane dehydrogenase subunit SoxC
LLIYRGIKVADKPRDLVPVAGNGLLDRRLFMKTLVVGSATVSSGMVFAQSAGQGQPEWILQPGATATGYGSRSGFEMERTKRWTVPPAGQVATGRSIVAFTPFHQMHGTITPSGLHFEINHHGIPDIDPDQHDLVIHGMVRNPIKLNIEALENYPTETHQYFLECAGNSGALLAPEPSPASLDLTHGLLSGSEWTGVALSTLLGEAGVSPDAKWLIVEGGDSGSLSRSIPLDKAMDDSMIAIYQNGERLRPGQGYPMRLFNPGYEGNTSIKWVRSIRLSDKPAMTRFETSNYTDLMPDGKALQFTFPMEVKSVITRPANTNTLPKKGVYEVTGLAWSGNGRITKVEVSADGGKTWAEAALQGPVLPKMLTRFRIPWDWQGGPAVLQSRAIDESGMVQPTREALFATKGKHSRYHFNGIHSWGVDEEGGIKHVYA